MTAAKISLKEGYSRGVMFSIGVSLTVIIQTYIAVLFARYLSNHPDIIDILQRVALVIFILISIYYLFIAKRKAKPQKKLIIKSKRKVDFSSECFCQFKHVSNSLSSIYEYYLVIFGLMDFDQTSIISYVAGAAMGTFVMLYIYIFFFDKIKSQKLTLHKNMNLVIGIITAVIAA